MTQSHEEIIADIKKKIFHPIYLLEGEEPYYIDVVSDFIERNLLPESERSFNQTILYGKETNALDIRTRAMNYPMFSNYQVIMVKEAQELKKWDDLEPYFEKPVKTTILILCHKHKNFDKRTKAAKSIQSNGVIMTSKKFYENQLPSFVEEIVEQNGLKIQSRAAHLIVEYVGNDLSRIVHELEKLRLNLKAKKEITEDDIELNIGISKEYNTFELNKALAFKDVLKANRIVDYFAANPRSNPLVLTLGSLQSYFSKIYLLQHSKSKSDQDLASLAGINVYNRSALEEYKTGVKNFSMQKVEDVFSLLHEYDLRSKGVNDVGTKEGALLKELVYKILH